MRISLNLIAEYLHGTFASIEVRRPALKGLTSAPPADDCIVTNSKEATIERAPQKRFSKIRLLPSDEFILIPGTIYVSDHIPNSASFEQGVGFLIAHNPYSVENNELSQRIVFVENTDVPSLLDRATSIFANFQSLEIEMSNALLHENGMQEMLDLLTTALGNPGYFADDCFRVLAFGWAGAERSSVLNAWEVIEGETFVSFPVIKLITHSENLMSKDQQKAATLVNASFFKSRFASVSLFHDDSRIGYLSILEKIKQITPGELALIDELSPYFLKGLIANPRYSSARGDNYTRFMSGVIRGTIRNREYIKDRFQAIDVQFGGRNAIARLNTSSLNDMMRNSAAGELENMSICKPVQVDETLCAIIPVQTDNAQQAAYSALNAMAKRYDSPIGVSEPFGNMWDIPTFACQALKALQYARPKTLSRFEDVYYRCMGNALANEEEKRRLFICSQVRCLKLYDEEHDTPYITTLRAYLESGMHVTRAAEALHIHRSTLLYRLDKIADAGKIDFSDTEELSRIVTSLGLLKAL